MEPSLTSKTGSSGSCSVLFSVRISTIRRADSPDIAIIAKTIENIMTEERICMPYTMSWETLATLYMGSPTLMMR